MRPRTRRYVVNFPFRRTRTAVSTIEFPESAHVMESTFCYAKCRFVLTCTCGEEFDTPYIDEALEYRQMHLELAPLADLLPAS